MTQGSKASNGESHDAALAGADNFSSCFILKRL
jgi:hypothetical protein